MLSVNEMIYDLWKCIYTDPATGEKFFKVQYVDADDNPIPLPDDDNTGQEPTGSTGAVK